jgi:serine phosphatase RsbU (regulator of sigma subunit)
MVIDCTGHGVSGAFVTMLVKAIERQVTSQINHSNDTISTADILSIFNTNIKHLLNQEDSNTISNVGFDGGIFYLNKKENIIKYSGANTDLYYIKNDKLEILKGDRHSVGYKKSDTSYQFNEYTLQVEDGTKIYLSTDGYVDQNGGDKGFSFGKKRFKSLLMQNYTKSMAEQRKNFYSTLMQYQSNYDRNDDITVIALKV